jgi:energy-coupling factor transporter ATP-binding protein EcfA2
MTKAYNELVNLLLSEEDRVTYEWVVGAVLSGENAHVLVIHGDPGSGKSTLLDIARRIFLVGDRGNHMTRVAFQHDGYLGIDSFFPETNVFAATLRSQDLFDDHAEAIHISTTGDRVSVNKHHVLMRQLYDEAPAVAAHCIDVYHNGPHAVYNQENNR